MQKKAVVNGLIYGAILLIVGIIAVHFLVSTTSMTVIFAFSGFLTFLIPVGVAIPFTLNLRKNAGGYWNLRQATTAIFVMFLTAYVVYSAGNFIYSRAIDKTINQRVTENIIKVTADFASRQNLPQEQIDEKIDQMRENMEAGKNPSLSHIVQSFIFSVIFIFIGALIFAAIFKRERPVFERSEE